MYVCVYVYICVYICMFCMHACKFVCVCKFVCMRVCMYVVILNSICILCCSEIYLVLCLIRHKRAPDAINTAKATATPPATTMIGELFSLVSLDGTSGEDGNFVEVVDGGTYAVFKVLNRDLFKSGSNKH